MTLEADVNAEVDAVARIVAVARRSSSPMFGDILWAPCPQWQALVDDPAVMFESPRRIVVFQRILGELRYYAGGWCLPDRQIEEQDRVWAEGSEQGVFASVGDALAFTERYLVEECCFTAIGVRRQAVYGPHPG